MDQHVLLVRYQVMSATRLHFSQLYFFATAFSLAFALGFYGLLHHLPYVSRQLALALTGCGIGIGAFVSSRLYLRERAGFTEMQVAWRGILNPVTGQDSGTLKKARPAGAMSIILYAQVLLALVLFAAAVLTGQTVSA
jgi:hypothetical protein